jgi:hypothetical protein
METTSILLLALFVLLLLLMVLMLVCLTLRLSPRWQASPSSLFRRPHQQAQRNAITNWPSPPPSYAHIIQHPLQHPSTQQVVQVLPHWFQTTHLDGTEDMHVELMSVPLYVPVSGESVHTLPRCEVERAPPLYMDPEPPSWEGVEEVRVTC